MTAHLYAPFNTLPVKIVKKIVVFAMIRPSCALSTCWADRNSMKRVCKGWRNNMPKRNGRWEVIEAVSAKELRELFNTLSKVGAEDGAPCPARRMVVKLTVGERRKRALALLLKVWTLVDDLRRPL